MTSKHLWWKYTQSLMFASVGTTRGQRIIRVVVIVLAKDSDIPIKNIEITYVTTTFPQAYHKDDPRTHVNSTTAIEANSRQ